MVMWNGKHMIATGVCILDMNTTHKKLFIQWVEQIQQMMSCQIISVYLV